MRLFFQIILGCLVLYEVLKPLIKLMNVKEDVRAVLPCKKLSPGMRFVYGLDEEGWYR